MKIYGVLCPWLLQTHLPSPCSCPCSRQCLRRWSLQPVLLAASRKVSSLDEAAPSSPSRRSPLQPPCRSSRAFSPWTLFSRIAFLFVCLSMQDSNAPLPAHGSKQPRVRICKKRFEYFP